MYRVIKLSVRSLVESVLRSGSIDDSYRSMSRALEGTRAHQKVQASYGEDYTPEVTLKFNMDYDEFGLELQGRADGIFERLDQDIIIEEIKSTTWDLEDIEEDHNEMHWAQAKCYGYIYMEENDLDRIQIKLTYYQLETEEVKEFFRDYSFEDLEKFFFDLIERYVDWANVTFYWLETRDKSIKCLEFPFGEYRKGQRELAVAVYRTIEEGKNIFAQAPTGIGKTISTLFPSIKAMGEKLTNKIFYLTAKTITREAPINSVKILSQQGLELKTLVITAKDKVCINHEVKCNPKDCKYANGHFDRVNKAIRDIFENENLFTRDVIIDYAEKHQVCPFEFSLDVSLWADLLVCDYNYVFDPQVQLQRFFDIDKDDYIFLIDEAHNLVDRAREMYSASLTDVEILEVIPIFKENDSKLYRNLNRLINIMDMLKEILNIDKEYYQEDPIDDLYHPIKTAMNNMDKWLVEEKGHEEYDKVLELYFNLLRYNKMQDFYDQHFWTSYKDEYGIRKIKINCIDPSYLIKQTMGIGRSSIMFSATLTPLEYFMDLLGGSGRDYHMILSSPFPRENLSLSIVSNISTRYKDRERTYKYIINYIESFIKARKGNYFIFFPSYAYMEKIFDEFIVRNPQLNVIIQESNMSEREREEFLEEFDRSEDLIGFVVMGGIFSEGIDLVGERLIGAAIIGVGMPRICFENNMIRDYYNKYMGSGFDYAYTFPGMNKVLQSAGRVIRTDKDKGAILLMDDRYGTYTYRQLFPSGWSQANIIKNQEQLEDKLAEFWKE